MSVDCSVIINLNTIKNEMNKRKIFLGLALILLSSMSVSSYAAGGPFFKTEPCPAGQSGRISYRNDSTSTPSAGRWIETSRNCVNNRPTVVRTMTETQNMACAVGETGSIQQKQTYEVWSDATKRNYSGWVNVSSTCKPIPSETIETKDGVQEESCDSYYGVAQGTYSGTGRSQGTSATVS